MLKDLNPPQREAAAYLDGALLVLAGAGSGKTRVITRKIAYLIIEANMQARNIAAVTFTNKAAREMKARVGKLLSAKQSRGLMVSTFHTLGLNILRREISILGYKSGFSILDAQDSMQLLQTISERSQLLDKERLQGLQNQISRWKNALVTPERAQAEAEDKDQHRDAHLYEQYQRQLKAYNAVDFDDLIGLPVFLFQQHPEVLEHWQKKIHYLLVDEYQDTNQCQYQLVRQLVGVRNALTVVGDDDQSIYAWRGAQPENLHLLKQDFPGLKVVKLEQNYRSSKRILKAANTLIRNNPHVFEKALWSDKGLGDQLRVLSTQDEVHEAEQVVSELISHRFQHQNKYQDYAILYRSNHQSRLFERMLRSHKIPYFLSGGTSFFSRSEIKDIMSYLRLVANPDDDNAFLRIINTPRREIGASTLEKLGTYATDRNISLFAACFELGLAERLSERALQRLQHFARWLTDISDRAERSEDPVDLTKEIIRTIDYEVWLQDTCDSVKAAERRMENIWELVEWLGKLTAESTENKKLADLVAYLTLMDILERQEENKAEENNDRVTMMTLHAAKGLEFPHVFLVGMEEEMLPHANTLEDEQMLQEERRLAYVGITRAQRSLTFSFAQQRKRYGEMKNCDPSRFLGELPEEDLHWQGGKQQAADPEARKAKGSANLAHIRGILK
ncbi:DNA helicase Rep [Candidatus Venteria ishoeyi]|uniref:DNA helicase Rep n=1 Tax=Candidatus Venteria ishoeyi TaxID=1899563 RepID=UPI0025A5BAB4|nr:DNA helicase Rep [Candidatus Venteria ishoeyi]MDM8545238.1 DNA helicase Rep [Candidatus Venteria ishoeyi]